MRIRTFLCAVATAVAVAGCGDDDDTSSGTTATKEPAAVETDLTAVKDFLLDHTDRLKTEVTAIREDAEAYYELAEAADFDYAALLETKRDEVAALIKSGQEGFQRAARVVLLFVEPGDSSRWLSHGFLVGRGCAP